MVNRFLFICFLIWLPAQAFTQDTLFFKLSNPWNTVKDPAGKYTRKCTKENEYYHVWDYNKANILVTESFYSDTNFTRKLFCHKYFNEKTGYLEQSRCYENGGLNGYNVNYNPAGDTTSYFVFKNGEIIKSWSINPHGTDNVILKLKAAMFPGGEKAWKKYLAANLVYPDSLQSIRGQVLLKFIINAEGLIDTVNVIKSLHPVLDNEATRVIMKSPKWKPGKQNGKKTKTIITQPINFGENKNSN